MSKQKRQREPKSPTLFDLPLNRGLSADEPAADAAPSADPADRATATAAGDVAKPQAKAPAGTSAAGSTSPAVQTELPSPAGGATDVAGAKNAAGPVAVPTPPPVAAVAPTLTDRLLAGIADLALHALLLALAALLVRAMEVPLSSASWPSFALLLLPFSFLYWVVPLAFWGQTPGMAWRGHRAIALDGEPLSFAQSALRWLGAVITAAFAGLPLLLSLAGGSLADRLSQSRTRVQTVVEPALAG